MEEREQPTYLIPANSKRSALIASMFEPFDLGLLITGIIITLMLLFIIQDNTFIALVIKLLPALVCAFLVIPIPNYHNTLVLIREVLTFFTVRNKFLWRGWCIYDGTDEKRR